MIKSILRLAIVAVLTILFVCFILYKMSQSTLLEDIECSACPGVVIAKYPSSRPVTPVGSEETVDENASSVETVDVDDADSSISTMNVLRPPPLKDLMKPPEPLESPEPEPPDAPPEPRSQDSTESPPAAAHSETLGATVERPRPGRKPAMTRILEIAEVSSESGEMSGEEEGLPPALET